MKTTTSTGSMLELIKASEIQISGNNPRKIFNESELQELSESIKLKGLLQPILVRPKEDAFELVCGERRLKASILAELALIPCFIRELSDKDAFEAMIIENMERADVHPMEEAEAFAKMLESGYSITDIALKVAKTEKFIAQRVKLNALIDAIKTDFYNNTLPIGHAFLIARQSEQIQDDIFNNYKGSWRAAEGYGTLKVLNSYINNYLVDLSVAKFDITAENLVPNTCACIICPKRSGANQLLFDDMIEKDYCLDSPCFKSKTEAGLMNQLRAFVENGSDVYFIDYGYNVDPRIIEFFKELDIPILKENKDYSLYKIDKVKSKKGIVVGGNTPSMEKKSIWLILEDKKEETTGNTQVDKIKSRAVRNLELDQEKIQRNISEAFVNKLNKDDIVKFRINTDMINTVVWHLALTNVGLWNLSEFMKEFEVEFPDIDSYEEYESFIMSLSDDIKMKIVLFMIKNEFKNAFPKAIGSKFLRKAYELYADNDIEEIVKAQDVKAQARIVREQERIDALTNK